MKGIRTAFLTGNFAENCAENVVVRAYTLHVHPPGHELDRCASQERPLVRVHAVLYPFRQQTRLIANEEEIPCG
jgi:hypothetical protein